MVLSPAWRTPALVQAIASLEADILCLQEVETETLAAVNARLRSCAFASRYARKRGGGPEGCAIFYREDVASLKEETLVAFAADGGVADGGNVAQILIYSISGQRLGIINTHLTWDPPGTAREDQQGLRQITQLLRAHEAIAATADGWIIAGDLNVTPGSEIVALIERSGFRFAHRDRIPMNTCSFNGEAKMIDYLFHSPQLAVQPVESVSIDARTVLPSAEQPSDHIPVVARFHWLP
jgi:endonuclease/exonuclease/phosphatase family metal-dependent hydrolase